MHACLDPRARAESLIPAVTHEGIKSQSTGLVTWMLFFRCGVDMGHEQERDRERDSSRTEGKTNGRGMGWKG